jgi:hypothetical protein
LFTVQLYSGLRLTGDHDDVARLNYRVTVSPLAGYYFIKQTNALLAVELGPSYVREVYRQVGLNDYVGLRIGQRGEYKFASGAKVWESLEFIPQITAFNHYLINAEVGVSAPISKALSISLILQDTYNNPEQLPPDTLKNDFKLIAGLTYNF